MRLTVFRLRHVATRRVLQLSISRLTRRVDNVLRCHHNLKGRARPTVHTATPNRGLPTTFLQREKSDRRGLLSIILLRHLLGLVGNTRRQRVTSGQPLLNQHVIRGTRGTVIQRHQVWGLVHRHRTNVTNARGRREHNRLAVLVLPRKKDLTGVAMGRTRYPRTRRHRRDNGRSKP